ncbi:hypothetical protein Gpo141_00006737 [Globisporangium polare]
MARASWVALLCCFVAWLREISSSCAVNNNSISSSNDIWSTGACSRTSRRRQTHDGERAWDVTHVDSALLPDYWSKLKEEDGGTGDPRIRTNGEAPEQLVKVTDRRHRHPVFATVCSLAFLLTIIGIIVICTH